MSILDTQPLGEYPATIPGAVRQVDALSGTVAQLRCQCQALEAQRDAATAECGELRRKHTEDIAAREAACADCRTAQYELALAVTEIGCLKAERTELYALIDSLRSERQL